jgi:hypothetical protein
LAPNGVRMISDLDTLAAEEVVEGAAEFGVVVVDQETDSAERTSVWVDSTPTLSKMSKF